MDAKEMEAHVSEQLDNCLDTLKEHEELLSNKLTRVRYQREVIELLRNTVKSCALSVDQSYRLSCWQDDFDESFTADEKASGSGDSHWDGLVAFGIPVDAWK